MTPKEVIEHDWKLGERFWEVGFIYDAMIGACRPIGVIEVEVIRIERDTRYKSKWESINLKLRPIGGSGNSPLPDPKDLDYRSTEMSAMASYHSSDSYYYHLDSCIDKYFDKDSAEKHLKKEAGKWNRKARTFRTRQLSKLDELMKAVEKQQKLVNSIDLDKMLIK